MCELDKKIRLGCAIIPSFSAYSSIRFPISDLLTTAFLIIWRIFFFNCSGSSVSHWTRPKSFSPIVSCMTRSSFRKRSKQKLLRRWFFTVASAFCCLHYLHSHVSAIWCPFCWSVVWTCRLAAFSIFHSQNIHDSEKALILDKHGSNIHIA